MMNLRNYFRIAFSDTKISDEKLAKFTDTHIQRLAANNTDGRYSHMMEETTSAYEAYFGAITAEDTQFAVQQSYTKSMQAVFEEFKKTVSQKEGAVRSIWNTDSPVYQEFFPYGMKEYSSSTLTNVEMLMARVVTAARAHEKEIGEPFIQLFADIQNRFIAARTAQLQKKGKVSESKDTSAQKRVNLERQLMKNLLMLAMEYMGNPDRGMDFYDQSIVYKPNNKDEEEENGEKKD